MKRIMAAVLAVLLSLSLFSACGDFTEESSGSPVVSESAEPAPQAEGRTKTLKDAAIGEVVIVKKLYGEGAIKRRIMDMGITKGTQLVIRKVAPLGDPIEINVRGYELSLRKEDAEKIEVE